MTQINMHHSLNNSHKHCHRNHMNSIFYKNIFRSINRSLCSTGRMPWVILHLWGFLYIRDAGRRGNKITDVKHIWNNSFLNCSCRWKWRMIIAVNFPILAIGKKKPQCVLWLHSSVGRAMHRLTGRSRVRIPLKPWFFSGFFFPIA